MPIVKNPQPSAAAPPGAAPAESRFRRLLDLGRGRRRPLLQLQHNPDPDALASGFALRHVWKRVFRVDPVLAFTGSVGRAENRAMIRTLRIPIVPAFQVNYRHHDFVATVDTQPGAGTCRLPDGVTVDVVVDHHPRIAGPAAPRLSIQDPEYGATSTLVGEMLLQNGFAIPDRIATALVYGIRTDTANLGRNASEADERVFAALYPIADLILLGRIQRARVPESYFRALETGLSRAIVHEEAVSTELGEVEHPDLVAEVADLLFRLEGTTWSLVTGSHASVLYTSVRCIEKEGLDAGRVARAIASVVPKGSGGGHETLAAAQIPIPAGETPARLHETVLSRFLVETNARRDSRRQLTPTPPAPAPSLPLDRRSGRATGRSPAPPAGTARSTPPPAPLPPGAPAGTGRAPSTPPVPVPPSRPSGSGETP